VLEKSDIVKDRTRNREMQKLRADLIVAENEKEESSVMLAEKEKVLFYKIYHIDSTF